jgi:hypothetical protein
MSEQLPIATLILKSGVQPAEIVKRAGYRSVPGGLRRLADLCAGDLSPRTKFLLDALPAALDLPAAEVQQAILATEAKIAQAQRAREEAEERRYRERFRPHVLWVTERDRPSSITMVAVTGGVERLLRFNLDAEQGEDSFVAQALAAMPPGVAFFGKTTGFSVNYSPDKCFEFDAQGNVVATFPRARRPGSADVTLRGDSRSILPLFGVAPPKPEN